MPARDPMRPGVLPRPRFIGRLARFALGAVVFWILLLILLSRLEYPPGSQAPTLLFLLAAAAALLWGVQELINIGLGRMWGRSAQIVIAVVIAGLLIVDLTIYGQLWAPPVAWFLFLLTEIVLGLAGINLILAAALAVPG